MDRGRSGRNIETRYGEGIQNPRARQRALCIAVMPGEPDLSELRELLRTAGVAVSGEVVQRRERPDPDRYMGRGKLGEVARASGRRARSSWPATTSCCRARSATSSRSWTSR
jgi:GTP-binding protein HflX